MAKKTKKIAKKKTSRRDGVLSPEELAIAIEEYRARHAERTASDDDDTEAKGAAETATDEGDDTVVAASGQEPETVEEQVQLVKDRRDRRDEADDPETIEEAQDVIVNQDEDIDTLLDIIDTLLAREAFDDAGEEVSEDCENTDEDDDAETESNADEGEEEVAEDDDDEAGSEENTDDDDEETAEDDDDEEIAEDDDDEETEIAEDDDDEEEAPAAETSAMNADSIDAIVRERIQLGMYGRALNLDGLENMSITKAKKKIIKAVRPGIRLDGRGKTFINAAYALACDEIKNMSKKDTAFQKKQMFNKKSTRADGKATRSGAAAARERMIKKMHKEGK